MITSVTITFNQFVQDSTTGLTGLSQAYIIDSQNSTDVYIPFSATSVNSVSLSFDDSYTGYCTYSAVTLTSYTDLYALHFNLAKDNQSTRNSSFSATVYTDTSVIYKSATFTIQQEGCETGYIINFENYDNTLLQTSVVSAGTIPSYTGSTPTRAADAHYTYAFNTWSPAVYAADKDETYTATYSTTVRKYTVYWKNYDNTILETDYNVSYGTMPTYNGQTPIRQQEPPYYYVFAGWYPSVSNITGNTTYKAQFNSYIINFSVSYETDNTLLDPKNPVHDPRDPSYDPNVPTYPAEKIEVPYGKQAPCPKISYPGYVIIWYTDPGYKVAWNFNDPVYSDLLLYPVIEPAPDDRLRVKNLSTGSSTVELTRAWKSFKGIEYSDDDGKNWTAFVIGKPVTLKTSGDTLLIRGIIQEDAENPDPGQVPVYGETNFHFSGEVGLAGNINYLWDYTNLDRPLYNCCGLGLFISNPSLVTASGLTIPTAEAVSCYALAFFETRLVEPPVLEERTYLGKNCYMGMFGYCKLKKSPVLPAEKGSKGCYESMFDGCTDLAEITCYLNPVDNSYTTNWVKNVKQSGIIYIHPKLDCKDWSNLQVDCGVPANFICKPMP
jgi:hypothetical protein